MDSLSRYRKAIYAAATSLVAGLLLVIEDGLTAAEGLQVAASVLAVVGGVYGLANDPAPIDIPDLRGE